MQASWRMMLTTAFGLALLEMPVASSAQGSGAFREGRGAEVQTAPVRLTLDLDDLPLRDVLKTIA